MKPNTGEIGEYTFPTKVGQVHWFAELREEMLLGGTILKVAWHIHRVIWEFDPLQEMRPGEQLTFHLPSIAFPAFDGQTFPPPGSPDMGLDEPSPESMGL